MAPSRRTLARDLESLADFAEPAPDLEQYLTPPELAAHLCHLAGLQGDLERPVVDLGTGTGMLAIGASRGGADRVVGIDVDPNALATAAENARRVDADVDWIVGDATRPPLAPLEETGGITVVSNPPFGAQRGNRHADRDFLEIARTVGAVSYTIHNEGSQEFVEAYADDEGGTVTHAFKAPFPIERRFEFHTEERTTLEAEIFRIEWL